MSTCHVGWSSSSRARLTGVNERTGGLLEKVNRITHLPGTGASRGALIPCSLQTRMGQVGRKTLGETGLSCGRDSPTGPPGGMRAAGCTSELEASGHFSSRTPQAPQAPGSDIPLSPCPQGHPASPPPPAALWAQASTGGHQVSFTQAELRAGDCLGGGCRSPRGLLTALPIPTPSALVLLHPVPVPEGTGAGRWSQGWRLRLAGAGLSSQ